jgi:hypothetical protein
VNVWVAGVGSGLPAASVATTSNVCEPSASVPRSRGDVHAANGPPSSRHWKVEPASFDENRNGLGPASIVVSGGVVSIVKVTVAGD